jgi:outer membrane lipoprotein LolB
VVLAGCASVVKEVADRPIMASQLSVAANFELRGRISVRINDRIESGQIRWSRSHGEDVMGLFSPLGTQVALVTQTEGGPARMRRGADVVEAATVDELAAELLGVEVGVDRIAGWVQGVGLRDGVESEAQVAGGVSWRVTAEQYQPASPYRFARRITAIRGDVIVKLVIDEWRPL